MERKKDSRISRTKRALVDSMIQCLRSETFENITVQRICTLANVRRATFYTHFADKYELFAYSINCMVRKLPAFIKIQEYGGTRDDFLAIARDGLEFLADHSITFSAIFKGQLTPLMLAISQNEMEQMILPYVIENKVLSHDNMLSPKAVIHFYTYGTFGLFRWWVSENCKIPKEELLHQMDVFTKRKH